MHAAAYPSKSNPSISLPRLSILGHPPIGQPPHLRTVNPEVEAEALSPALVLFGLDERGKAHASWFSADEADSATAAAGVMNLSILPVENDAIRTLASQLPHGKIFTSGKAFVPFVKAALYEALIDHLPDDERERARQPIRANSGKSAATGDAAESGAATVQRDHPEDWSKIKVGSLVLASDGPGDGWYEADVIEALPEDRFKLRWYEWPDLPDFVRPVTEIALLHPQHQQG